jgi:hypothetical protein
MALSELITIYALAAVRVFWPVRMMQEQFHIGIRFHSSGIKNKSVSMLFYMTASESAQNVISVWSE